MITVNQYFSIWPHTPEHTKSAYELIRRVNELLEAYQEAGGKLEFNQKTKSYISGDKFGGFRPQDCPIGAPQSAHKCAQAVDIYDPDEKLDKWVNDAVLEKFDLYREAASHTAGWCHLQSRKTKSGKRTFLP